METRSIVRGVRLSADKGRLVADLVRGKKVDQAINILNFTQKRAAGIIKKALESAIANAEHNDGADIDELKVKTIYVEQGATLKRFSARAKGPVPFSGPNQTFQNAEWYSFGNWFLYEFNDKLTGVWRSEVFRDDDGVRTGFADNFYEQTLGLIYKPHSWLWVRPEARYDWAQFTKPYNDSTRSSQFTLGFDVILLF